ncbi:MAG: tetratricopeptide repeat protein, partial [Bacteroidales bacterium]
PRRLSVSYTNKATAYRHMMMQDSALVWYDRALALWKDNRTAESNLSVLLGGEPVKPGIIKTLFPPDRKKR